MKASKELKRISRENLMGHYRLSMGAFLITFLIPLMIELPFSMLLDTEYATSFQRILFLLAEFFISILAGMLQIGLYKFHLSMARHQPYGRSQVFYCFRNHSEKYVLGYLIALLINLIGLAPAIGAYFVFSNNPTSPDYLLLAGLCILSLLLSVVITLTWQFTFCVMLDNEDLNVLKCFRTARKLMRGNKLKLLYLYLSFIGMELLVVISLGVGALWVNPYRLQTMTNFYLELYSSFDEYV